MKTVYIRALRFYSAEVPDFEQETLLGALRELGITPQEDDLYTFTDENGEEQLELDF